MRSFLQLPIAWRRISAVALFLLGATTAYAQQPTAAEENDKIKQLLQRIEQLESRVKELETRQAPAAAATEAQRTSTEAEKPLAAAHGAMHDSTSSSSSPALQIHGFSDVGYHVSDQKGETNSFGLGQIDLFISSRLSDQFSVLGELVLEANEKNEFGFEAERLLIQYSQSDYFNLSIGRYHTSIGYYNTAFHHGTWFQTATGRPFIFAFEDEGGILPIHNVGLSATGRIPSGKLGLHYVAEIGNGRSRRTPIGEPVQNTVDENNGKAFNLGVFVRPDWLPGFQAGFSVYRDRLTPDGLPKIDETIAAAHFIYQGPSVEWLNEGVLVRHAPFGAGRAFNTGSFYTQISRKFGKWRPYFRYQYVNVPEGDQIIGDAGRQNGPSAGLRFDATEFAAFKVQYDRSARRMLDSINGLTLQVAFTF